MTSPSKSTVLIDLSGTIHVEDKEINGSISALEKLRKSKINIKFVTNTTKESKRILLQRLTGIGFSISEDEIFTSLTAAHDTLKARELRPFLLIDNKALEDFMDLHEENPNCVVVGLAPDKFSYKFMNEAFKLLLTGAPLIAVHKSRYFKTKTGLALGPGPFISGLEYSSGIKAEIIGKPSAEFFKSAVKEFKSEPKDCYMVGDDVRDDIGGSQAIGMKGLLVRSGKYRPGDENKIEPPPYNVVNNFSEAVEIILAELKEASL
ncbi:haloacid dehalogenase-like hydrolase domain-containing protein 2 [Patella vulgata]|uniref:haloacid dehalogenase-like hydrolase domain-containing protein 2 n=1 Tax=Patella vulgata TaxID=6465 RepID=UPI002180888A|nr:haloacid dehalogenase-like hydrolase domain-containing protein 2 [Patella vulgata]